MIENNGSRIQAPKWYESIDPGIRFAVRVLHAKGINTGQSCEGGEGHAYSYPTVDLWGYTEGDQTGFAALAALSEYRIPVRSISFEWSVQGGGGPFENFWRVELIKPLHERADDLPMFAWSYTYYSYPGIKDAG